MASAVDLVRLHRLSAPDAIEADLAALWIEAGRQAPVTRALMSNLVVFHQHPPGARVDFAEPIDVVPLDEVVRRHPSRAVVIHHTPSDTAMRAPVAAAVTAVIFGADGFRYGAEQIAVRSSSAAASLPSIVRHLVRGDVPTSIWWADDLSDALLPSVVEMGRQLIYDSRMWRDPRRGVLALAPLIEQANAPDLGDLNWRRLAPLRRAVIHAAATFRPVLAADSEARIFHRAGDEALAWLLAGWLWSRLGNDPDAGGIRVHVEAGGRDDEVLRLSLAGLSASITRQHTVVEAPGSLAIRLPIRAESDADAVAAELANLSHDVGLRDALAALARRFR